MDYTGGEPCSAADELRTREMGAAAELQKRHLPKDLLASLGLDESALNTFALPVVGAEAVSAAGGSTLSELTERDTACGLLADAGCTKDPSFADITAAFDRYRAAGRLPQPQDSGRPSTSLSSLNSTALLSSALDSNVLLDGLKGQFSTGVAKPQVKESQVQGLPARDCSGEKAASQALRLLEGADLSTLQGVMNDLAATDHLEMSSSPGIFPSLPSNPVAVRAGGEYWKGQNKGQQERIANSSALFTKLLGECQASGCDLTDVGGDQFERKTGLVKPEGWDKNPDLSRGLLALLQHQQAFRAESKLESSKRLLASLSSSASDSMNPSRRNSNCSPRTEEDGTEEARGYKRRILELNLLDQRRSSFASSTSSSSVSSDLKVLAASLAGSREGDALASEIRAALLKFRQPGQEPSSAGDSPTRPMSPTYLAELQFLERAANTDPSLLSDEILAAAPLGYYNVSEAPTTKLAGGKERRYPIVRGVSRDNTKKRWAVYWKGYRRYFYDKFYDSCPQAYKRAVHFRQQATEAAAAVAATGNPAHLIAAGLHGSPSATVKGVPQIKVDPSKTAADVLASAAAAIATDKEKSATFLEAAGAQLVRGQDNDRTNVCLYKEAILFIMEDLRNKVLTQHLGSRAAGVVNAGAETASNGFSVEVSAAATAKRMLDQLLLVHTSLVGNATSLAELQPSLTIVAPCLEDLKLPSQQTTQQQLQLLQSVLAMHIQQLLLLSRYLNKGNLPLEENVKSCAEKSGPPDVKVEAGQNETPLPASQEQQQEQVLPSSSLGSPVHVPA